MSGYNSQIHRRRSVRLSGYDYSRSGLYFVTICVNNRACVFGEVVEHEMRLNKIGNIAKREWIMTPNHRPYVVLHDFVIMPNHIHGIIKIAHTDTVGALRATPLQTDETVNMMSEKSPKEGTLPTIIRAYKSAVSKKIHETNIQFSWQRNYYEHIVRDERSYNKISEYINANPAKWEKDRYFGGN